MLSLDQIYDILMVIFQNIETPGMAEIESQINTRCDQLKISLSDEQKNILIARIHTALAVTMPQGQAVSKRRIKPWIHRRRDEFKWKFWTRYEKYLGLDLRLPPATIRTIHRDTDGIIDQIPCPDMDGPWKYRGLVIGNVQAGKTANYTGLINKATDIGYHLIIVIAGIQNRLRSQTQQRIEEGFVGRSTNQTSDSSDTFVGVGLRNPEFFGKTLTSVQRDFNKNLKNIGLGAGDLHNLVLVIKKNASVLDSLTHWLTKYTRHNGGHITQLPLLLIDDEADSASINTKREWQEEATRINSLIRTLLNKFDKSCYIGYTATPFANIFIDPDTASDMYQEDLFPEDFIYLLETPSNYSGAEKMFLQEDSDEDWFTEDDNPHLRIIDDNEDEESLPVKHLISFEPEKLPPSLITAIHQYVIAGAIRTLASRSPFHHSMMINVSRFTDVQFKIRNLIDSYFDTLSADIVVNSLLDPSLVDPESLLKTLHKVWRSDFSLTDFSWEDVKGSLKKVCEQTSIRVINSNSPDQLNYHDYPEGLFVITIGGLSLSRGLTLEGLCISYFLRNSIMYDTLFQMARWFGFRDGYQHLCKVWLKSEAVSWYQHIAIASQDLRQQIIEMNQSALTPRQFGLMVRRHPDSLIVTSRNKMRTAQKVSVQVSLGGKLRESYCLPNQKKFLKSNFDQVLRLLRELRGWTNGFKPGNRLWRNVTPEFILHFIKHFEVSGLDTGSTSALIINYFNQRMENGECLKWDVVLEQPSPKRRSGFRSIHCQGFTEPFYLNKRSASGNEGENEIRISKRSGRVGQPNSEIEGYTKEELTTTFGTEGLKEKIRDIELRKKRQRPLLLLYFLDLYGDVTKDRSPFQKDIVAWGISIPLSEKSIEDSIEYQVNLTWWKNNFKEEFSEDEEDFN